MNGITKLKGLSNYTYVPRNMFQAQGDNINKVFIFKVSKVSPSSEVYLVRSMQPN